MQKIALPLLAAALAAGSALAQQPPPSAREACRPDVQRLCPNLQPGERPGNCLREHRDQISDACKEAIVRMRAAHQAARTGAPPSTGAPPPN